VEAARLVSTQRRSDRSPVVFSENKGPRQTTASGKTDPHSTTIRKTLCGKESGNKETFCSIDNSKCVVVLRRATKHAICNSLVADIVEALRCSKRILSSHTRENSGLLDPKVVERIQPVSSILDSCRIDHLGSENDTWLFIPEKLFLASLSASGDSDSESLEGFLSTGPISDRFIGRHLCSKCGKTFSGKETKTQDTWWHFDNPVCHSVRSCKTTVKNSGS
jgi:hypothetical protein